MYNWLQKHLKLAHHSHTGQRLPRPHSSNGALLLIVIAAGLMLILATHGLVANADSLSQPGSLTITGIVGGSGPTQAAVIAHPKNGRTLKVTPTTVSGSCQSGGFVEVYDNDELAGATTCLYGQFGLNLDLVIGANKLIARTLDNLQQHGPDSSVINVTYQAVKPVIGNPNSVTSPTQKLKLRGHKMVHSGVAANKPYTMTLNVAGGQPPYAINVEWGDGTQSVVSQPTNNTFTVSHTYVKGEVYYLKITTSDAVGNKSLMENTVSVSAPTPAPAAPITKSTPPSHSVQLTLDVIWPMYVAVLVTVTTFWLGERYEKRELQRLWKTNQAHKA